MKKKLLVWSNFSRLNTGFGGSKKRILRWFHKHPDWEVVEAAAGIAWDSPDCQKLPWKCYGLAPDQNQQAQINAIQDEGRRAIAQRDANYGALRIDEVIKLEKPHYFLCQEDSWSFDNILNRHWHSVLPTFYNITLDSVPFLSSQIDMASKVKIYPWATFAEEEYKKLGYDAKTIPGTVDEILFSPISEEKRKELRARNKISDDEVIFFMAGRSQLRKSFPNVLDGFKLFKEKNPDKKAKVFFHCSWSEGWALPQIINDKGIDPNNVLTTYYCKHCRQWEIRSFFGPNQDCPHCNSKGTYDTCNIVHGISDEEMAFLYGVSDLVFNCVTSGGFEYSVWQAKMCEKITSVTSYSCGTDACYENSGGWPVDWAPYMEPSSNFIKSSSKAESICEHMEKFINLSDKERKTLEKRAREFAVDWCSTESVCQKWIEEFSKFEPANWENFDWTPPSKNPSHQPPPNLSPQDFVLDLFKNVLLERVDKNHSQVKHWTEHLTKSQDYQGVYDFFVRQAHQANAQAAAKPVDFETLLNPNDGKRLLICMPESAGDVLIVASLVPKVRKQYPEFAIYFATKPQFKDFVEHLEGVTWLEYFQAMDDIFWLTGRGDHKGYFDIAFLCQNQTQRSNMAYQFRREEPRLEWINNIVNQETVTQ